MLSRDESNKKAQTIESGLGKQMMAQAKFYMGYSRWDEENGRYETWDEAVARVMNMHRAKYAHCMTEELAAEIDFAEEMYRTKRVLGAQRALQFGGDQIFKHEARLYNCSSSYADRPEFFQEAMYLLLCGCGVGFSVQTQHVAKLPDIAPRSTDSKLFAIPDSIEGWADAFGVLLSSYFVGGGSHPEYQGSHVAFDFSQIRPKGAFISGGFKAPGPDSLQLALQKCEKLLEAMVSKGSRMSTIGVYDFVMHMSDAVLSGGVRRSATICLFSKDDQDMLNAKTGNWFVDNPQRGRSNNSAMLLRDELTRDEWAGIMKSVKAFGEPGFVFTHSLDAAYNPCVEIGMKPKHWITGKTGFQMCNLTEINGGMCRTPADLMKACVAGAILGTLQAGYTNFTYLTQTTKEIVDREALLGVSITGWMNNPDVLFNKDNLLAGAALVKATNRKVAAMIGINPAPRTTCAKPSGNASVKLGTASGIHGEHSLRYFRNVQMNDTDGVLHLIQKVNPEMVEASVWSQNGTDKVVSFPITSDPQSIFKADLMGVKQLEYVKLAQQYWVEGGTDETLAVDPQLRHNISNTISVDDWDELEQYLFDNRQWFAGVSLLSSSGDKDFAQAPFTEVATLAQITERYGSASLLASGLVVDGLYAFHDDLWKACATVLGIGDNLHPTHRGDLMKRDWVRRAEKFAQNFFSGDLQQATYCLKDVYNFHKWESLLRHVSPINFTEELSKQSYTDVNTMGAQACAGGVCDIQTF
jgi:ribonucleoside-diphosphate reductase alpha chain